MGAAHGKRITSKLSAETVARLRAAFEALKVDPACPTIGTKEISIRLHAPANDPAVRRLVAVMAMTATTPGAGTAVSLAEWIGAAGTMSREYLTSAAASATGAWGWHRVVFSLLDLNGDDVVEESDVVAWLRLSAAGDDLATAEEAHGIFCGMSADAEEFNAVAQEAFSEWCSREDECPGVAKLVCCVLFVCTKIVGDGVLPLPGPDIVRKLNAASAGNLAPGKHRRGQRPKVQKSRKPESPTDVVPTKPVAPAPMPAAAIAVTPVAPAPVQPVPTAPAQLALTAPETAAQPSGVEEDFESDGEQPQKGESGDSTPTSAIRIVIQEQPIFKDDSGQDLAKMAFSPPPASKSPRRLPGAKSPAPACVESPRETSNRSQFRLPEIDTGKKGPKVGDPFGAAEDNWFCPAKKPDESEKPRELLSPEEPGVGAAPEDKSPRSARSSSGAQADSQEFATPTSPPLSPCLDATQPAKPVAKPDEKPAPSPPAGDLPPSPKSQALLPSDVTVVSGAPQRGTNDEAQTDEKPTDDGTTWRAPSGNHDAPPRSDSLCRSGKTFGETEKSTGVPAPTNAAPSSPSSFATAPVDLDVPDAPLAPGSPRCPEPPTGGGPGWFSAKHTKSKAKLPLPGSPYRSKGSEAGTAHCPGSSVGDPKPVEMSCGAAPASFQSDTEGDRPLTPNRSADDESRLAESEKLMKDCMAALESGNYGVGQERSESCVRLLSHLSDNARSQNLAKVRQAVAYGVACRALSEFTTAGLDESRKVDLSVVLFGVPLRRAHRTACLLIASRHCPAAAQALAAFLPDCTEWAKTVRSRPACLVRRCPNCHAPGDPSDALCHVCGTPASFCLQSLHRLDTVSCLHCESCLATFSDHAGDKCPLCLSGVLSRS